MIFSRFTGAGSTWSPHNNGCGAVGAAPFVSKGADFLNLLLLHYATRGLHFVTSGCFTNVASVERISARFSAVSRVRALLGARIIK